jgi:hypothetical protein
MTIMSRALGLLLALGIGLLACDSIGAESPGTRVLQALELVRTGTPPQLEDYVLRKDISRAGMLYDLLSRAFGEKGGVARLELESERINGERATVKVRFHYNDGGSPNQSFPLQREEGKWRFRL